MLDYVDRNPLLKAIIVKGNNIMTRTIYIVYPIMIIVLLIRRNPEVMPSVVVPGISFVLVSIFRSVFNSPRPYEVYCYSPIIHKDSKGKSFPSRHIFSVFIIAVTLFRFIPAGGILVGLCGVFMAFARVAGGVHFPKDVIAGMVIGILCGICGFEIWNLLV